MRTYDFRGLEQKHEHAHEHVGHAHGHDAPHHVHSKQVKLRTIYALLAILLLALILLK